MRVPPDITAVAPGASVFRDRALNDPFATEVHNVHVELTMEGGAVVYNDYILAANLGRD